MSGPDGLTITSASAEDVLSPSARSVPFYRRAGFAVADQLLVSELAGPEGYIDG